MFNPDEETSMTQPARPIPCQTDELPRELIDLANAIGNLPAETRRDLDPLLAKVVDSSKRRRRILQLVQDALGQLRLDMKYLMFDLEATRRERDDFHRQLDG
jgi:hypothetical protein